MADNSSTHRAGLFDIRIIIGALIGIYGVVLVITGLIGSDDKVADAGTINLWVGIALVVVSAGFIAWARLRPIVVPDHVEDDDRPPAH